VGRGEKKEPCGGKKSHAEEKSLARRWGKIPNQIRMVHVNEKGELKSKLCQKKDLSGQEEAEALSKKKTICLRLESQSAEERDPR